MKILFIHNRYQYAGGEDAVLLMEIAVLESYGHQTQLLEFNNRHINSFGSRVKTGMASFYNFHSAKRVKEAINSFRPDIIHVHNLFFTASPSVLFAAARMQVPVVMTIHNFRLLCANALLLRNNQPCELCTGKRWPLHGIKYKCYRSSAIESALVTAITGTHKLLHTWQHKVNRFIALSDFMKAKLVASSLQVPGNKIAVKANFTTPVAPGSAAREDFYFFAGRLSKEKGIEILLQAFLAGPEHRLIIAGDGPEKEWLMDAIKNAPWITYAGLQPKEGILALMKRSRALVFPSVWYEGMPATILESFSTGTPVICSARGAMSSMVEDGVNGYRFTPGNAAGLKQCIAQLEAHTHPEALYRQALQTYNDKYTPGVHYAAIMTIYNETIAEVQPAL